MDAVTGSGKIDRQMKTAVRLKSMKSSSCISVSASLSTAGFELFDMASSDLTVLLKPIVT